MKKIISIFMAASLFIMSMTSNVFAANSNSDGTAGNTSTNISNKVTFSDISGHWAEATISKWQEKNIISGYPDGTFKPDNPVTRAELAKIITLAFNLNKADTVNFDDIDTSSWYYSYLECSAKYIPVYKLPESNETNLPYVENYEKGGNGFLPNTDAIRMHVAEALVEIKKEQGNLNIDLPTIQDVKNSLNETFNDADYENLYANHGKIPTNVERMFNYTYLANKLEIMQGDTNGYFRPYDKITRAELITMIDRIAAE